MPTCPGITLAVEGMILSCPGITLAGEDMMPSCPGITRQHYTIALYSLHVHILSFHFISLVLMFRNCRIYSVYQINK